MTIWYNVGLILIVLEGALEIHFDKGKLGMLRRAILSALFVLLATGVLIAIVLKVLGDEGWYVYVLNALPFAVISSSIAIPSVAHMLISVVFCLGLVLVYALAKQFHLSSLIIVLAFGLLLNNADRMHHPVFARIFHYPKMGADLDQMKTLTAESAFLIRTFFFLLFGSSIILKELGQLPLLAPGAFMGDHPHHGRFHPPPKSRTAMQANCPNTRSAPNGSLRAGAIC